MEQHELTIILLNLIMALFAYVWLYPRLSTVDVIKISFYDLLVSATSIFIAGLLFWGTDLEFGMLFFSVNWFWYTLITFAIIEIPLFIWFVRKFDLWESYLDETK